MKITDIIVESSCKHGQYYCSTDKKWKCRQGPKQSRATEAANPAQQAATAIAISKKKEKVNEFAPDGFSGGGDDGEEFSPEMAKMAYDEGVVKGASLADGATIQRAMAINDWDKHDGGIYSQHFAKGFIKGRMDKIRHNNEQYNLNLQLMKDGSIRHGERSVAEGWKEKVGAAAMASAMATAAGANTPKVPLDQVIRNATAWYNINKAVKKQKEKSKEETPKKTDKEVKEQGMVEGSWTKPKFNTDTVVYNGAKEKGISVFSAGYHPGIKTAWIEAIKSDEPGAGKNMIRSFEQWAKSQGAKTINAEALASSLEFWKKMGFVVAGKPSNKNRVPIQKNISQQGVAEEKQRLDPKCWDGYKKQGTKMKGGVRVNNCVKEDLEETYEGNDFYEAYGELWFNEDEQLDEAEYQGRKVQLGKPMRGDVKKFKVYVKDPSTGNIKKVNFGDPDMKIRKSNPKARKSFRARHNCDNPGPRTKARYWSCRKW